MSEHTFPVAELENRFSQLPQAALESITFISGEGDEDRVLVIADEFDAQLAATDPAVYAPPAYSDVTAERDRRLSLDFTFNGVQFQRDIDAVRRINGAGTLALAAIVGGAQPGDLRWHGEDTDFAWISSDNSLVPMDAQTVMAFGSAAAKRETEIIFAAKALKAMVPIPADYTNDLFWP
ncbi:DUF4376 domain-containing protein [Hoeflea sp.]|uniref:DUF4376 domain-containing protein n=1 Tax=Hoeflea sp. TaxID=1940281 RepID=UPI0025C2BFBC|nr:DUF4376 domain-containing protein [Hoeflea sp.]